MASSAETFAFCVLRDTASVPKSVSQQKEMGMLVGRVGRLLCALSLISGAQEGSQVSGNNGSVPRDKAAE
ncbi:hypothetical protein N7454_005408 [Penicillium verhagenii]|nr:hypothetical protein N7454_005408 [Penicillium verhagenii]